MSKTKVRRVSGIKISLYRKRENRVSVVFRKNRVLYRINSVSNADRFIAELKACGENMEKGSLIQFSNVTGGSWVLEAGIVAAHGLLTVWKMVDGGMPVVFKWEGSAEELVF